MFLSTGKLVKNTQLISKYIEELNKRGIESSTVLPSTDDIEFVERAVKNGYDMLYIMNALIQRFISRIDPKIAKEVFKKVLNEEVDEETASYLIAKEFSAWVLEIAETLNIIKINNKII